MKYEQALEELKSIIQELQNGQTNIDELEKKSQRASELIRFCKEKLRNTEESLKEIFEE